MPSTNWKQSQEHTRNHYGDYNLDLSRIDLINKLLNFSIEPSEIDQPENTILEIGAYHGITPGFNHATTIGIDPLANKEYLVKGVGETLPIKTGTMDYVFSWNTLDHVKQPKRVLKEVARVLKPHGELLLCVNVYDVGWFVHRHVISRFGQHHPWYFRPMDTVELVCDAGFTITMNELHDPSRDYFRWLFDKDLLAIVSIWCNLKLHVLRGVSNE